jgi:hypothetical protein
MFIECKEIGGSSDFARMTEEQLDTEIRNILGLPAPTKQLN